MTDNEIIKDSDCLGKFVRGALDLINRKDAEIERLEVKVKTLKAVINYNERQSKTAKSEAIKKFAERLKKESRWLNKHHADIYGDEIDNLVAEMTEQKG